MRDRGPRPTALTVPVETPKPYDLSASGTFTEGDFMIGRHGMRIAHGPDANGGGGGGGAARQGSAGAGAGQGGAAENGGGASSRPASSRSASSAGASSPQGSARTGTGVSEDGAERGGECAPSTRDGSGSDVDGAFDIALEDIRVLGVIGSGSSGVVQKAVHVPTNNVLAVKVIQMDVQESVRKNIIQELRTLHSSFCKFIVPYLGAFLSEGSISIVLEYMDGGSLTDLTRASKGVPEPMLAALTRQVLQGLLYLHKEMHIIHRDIKPSNMMVNQRGELKIGDFGVSGQLANSVTRCYSWVGTVTYMSPERISGKAYSFDSDIWSLGLSLVECATGRFPYPPPDHSPAGKAPMGFWDLLDYIVEKPPPALPSNTHSPEFCSFINSCLQKDPKDRKSAADLLDHPWLNKHDVPQSELAAFVQQCAATAAEQAAAEQAAQPQNTWMCGEF